MKYTTLLALAATATAATLPKRQDEAPAVEAPAVETPVTVETPVVEVPAAVETTAIDAPAAEAGDPKVPAPETPVVEIPAPEAPIVETPVAVAPAAETQPAEPPAVWENKDTLCKGWDLNTPEGVDALWQQTAAGDELDIFLLTQWEHENNWLKNLEDAVQDGTVGKTGAAGCASVANECNPMDGMKCDAQFDQLGGKLFSGTPILGKNSYWIFQAAKGAHSKFKAIKAKLIDTTLVSGLEIGQMATDFGGDESDTADIVKWLSAAASLGGALGGLATSPVFSAGFGVLGAAFGVIADDKEKIDQGSISAGLAQIFKATSARLDNLLAAAMGVPLNPDDYNLLPDPKPDPWYKSKISKFFNGGWFLLNDDTRVVRETIESITKNIQPKIANNVMKAGRLHLVADKRYSSREACGYSPGRQWMALKEGEEYCFHLMRKDVLWNEVDDSIYEKMASYGLGNREQYYRSVLDCALSPVDSIDLSNMEWGKIPTCYFDLPAVFIEDMKHACWDKSNCANIVGSPIKG
ncbi:hypothetical protein F53441_12731 [Fusarium austroafricanum]|uniref:Uncharacterized protein n=1 Tax=Fusarium austroafricanum TaxID=2364996 RepID=A0A8H4JTG6_9HYPO|nr:hypothetical protein F53441_12731 [Fusarium austroafricanum]